MKSLLIGCSLVLIAATPLPQTSLRRMPKVGDTAKYSLHMELEVFGDQAVYTSTVEEKVTEVTAQGYTVAYTQTGYRATAFGEEAAVADSDMPQLSTTYGPRGEVVSIQGTSLGPNDQRMANFGAFPLPEGQVKVGDAWKFEQKEDLKKGKIGLLYDAKLTGEEKMLDTDCWVLQVEFKEIKSTPETKASTKVWLSKATSTVVRSEATWKNAPISGSPQPLSGKVTFKLVK